MKTWMIHMMNYRIIRSLVKKTAPINLNNFNKLNKIKNYMFKSIKILK